MCRHQNKKTMELTPELIEFLKQEIAQATEGVKANILSEVHKANQGLAASLTKKFEKVAEDGPSGDEGKDSPPKTGLTLKALQGELEGLREQLAQKEKAAYEASSSQALTQTISKLNPQNPTALYKILKVEYGERLKAENGSWYVSQGEDVQTLEDAIKSYLETDEGKYFVPSSGIKGSDSQETSPAALTRSPNAMSSLEALSSAFANY